MILIADFEVFKQDWVLVTMFADTKKYEVIANNREQLLNYYTKHRNDLYVFYNGRNYDVWIYRAILAGIDPKEVNDYIIKQGRSGATFSPKLNKFPITFFDAKTTPEGLKTLEGMMGSDIQECSIDFDLERKLTSSELATVIRYCKHDVQETYNVWAQRIADYKSHIDLCKMFKLPDSALGKTKAQLAAMALQADGSGNSNDEFAYEIPDNLHITKYEHVIEWFAKQRNGGPAIYQNKLEVMADSCPLTFAWGGMHGALLNYHTKGVLINCDCSSFYPSIMLTYGYQSRAIPDKAIYADVYHKRLEYKAAKDPRQQPLKIVLKN